MAGVNSHNYTLQVPVNASRKSAFRGVFVGSRNGWLDKGFASIEDQGTDPNGMTNEQYFGAFFDDLPIARYVGARLAFVMHGSVKKVDRRCRIPHVIVSLSWRATKTIQVGELAERREQRGTFPKFIKHAP